jgi:uncharacterized membrane protein YkvA (DUF1232 family)
MYWLSRGGQLFRLVSHLRLAARLFREPRVPVLTKALPVLAVAYIAWPLDIIPDLLPFLGQLDDVSLMLLAFETFMRIAPSAAVAFHRAAIAKKQRYAPMVSNADVIDAEWRRE